MGWSCQMINDSIRFNSKTTKTNVQIARKICVTPFAVCDMEQRMLNS